MKPSARLASLFILLFFLFFNSLQVYLITERISETKNKFNFECSAALASTLSEYHRLKVIDSASMPDHALIVYSPQKNGLSRADTQGVKSGIPYPGLATDTIEPAFIESILNSSVFRSIDIPLFDSLFKKALQSKQLNAQYRLDTITMTGKKIDRQLIPVVWNKKKRKEYFYFTAPMRMPYNSGIFVFAQFKNDLAFTRNDLFWPMLAFAAILLIGNTALVFVYRTISKQKKINEIKTDFINNMTHEMKTPITIASAGLEALEHHITPTERTGFYLDTSKKQLRLLNDFAERILDAAVQDIPDFILKKEKTDLHALFEELIQNHAILQGKPVSFRLTGTPVFIQCDRLYLKTAFHNIIDNAIKYSNESVIISIDIAENNREAIIKIRDNGIGIPAQYIKNIFEKFFRVPRGDAQSVKGFGLGLYYVSSIIKKHSGNITAHSKWQSGTEFIITLPK